MWALSRRLLALLVLLHQADHVDSRTPQSPCPILNTSSDCVLQDGCTWCWGDPTGLGRLDGTMSCLDWRLCQGPLGSCTLNRDEASCLSSPPPPPPSKRVSVGRDVIWGDSEAIGAKGEGVAVRPINTSCIWCKISQRCVDDDAHSGQCKGCDGSFDSGVEVDVCGNCGGGCVDSVADFKNPFCGCLGCDNVLHSNLTMDACGVCGGTNSTCFPFQSLTRQERIGIVLALCGNVLISVSLNTQKYAHNMNEVDSGGSRSYMELPMWWVGLVLMTLGETGNFLAYAYAPATLVAPLGAITVISNCILANYVLKETITHRNVAGVILAIVGAVLIVRYAPGSEKQLTMDLLEHYMAEPVFIIYMLCLVSIITSLFLTKETHKKRYVVIYVLICSMTGSITVMCVKGVSTALILTMQGHNQFIYFIPWLLLVTTIGTIVIQMKYLNLAMINFGASEVVPVYYVLFTFWSILGGMVLYKEYHQNCPAMDPDCRYTLWFLLGCAITFSGVYLITFDSKDASGSFTPSFGRSPSLYGELAEAPETERLLGDGNLLDDDDDEEAALGAGLFERSGLMTIDASGSARDISMQMRSVSAGVSAGTSPDAGAASSSVL